MNEAAKHVNEERQLRMKEDTESKSVIGPNSMVRMGLLVSILAVLCGGAGGSIWWASKIQAGQDHLTSLVMSIVAGQKADGASLLALAEKVNKLEIGGSENARDAQAKVADLTRRVDTLYNVGSPALIKVTDAHERRLEELEREFAVHKAQIK